jgi:hypothetical protein
MAVNIDTTTALRGVHDLQRLVEAVIDADEHDEFDWVEWKSTLDLSTKAGCFHVARAVLGMANRLPDRAGLTCEGLGYIIVGVEPHNLQGVASVDPATMDQFLDVYLGGVEGPRYTSTYVSVQGKTALVVVVEAPTPGDPIFSLRREFGNARSGTVFIRKPGRTAPADAKDLDALQTRLLTRAAPPGELEVSLVGDVPISWIDAPTVPDVIRSWVAQDKAELVAAAEETERRRQPQPSSSPEAETVGLTGIQPIAEAMARQTALSHHATHAMESAGFLGEQDKRTIEEYVAEVDEWAEHRARAAPEVVQGKYVSAGHGVVALTVHNPTGRFLPDVEVEAHFEGDTVTGLDQKPPLEVLPPPPRPYGQRRPSNLLSVFSGFDHRPSSILGSAIVGRNRRTWVEDGSVRLVFRVGDLRQHATDTSDDVYLLLNARPEGGMLRGTWKATIRDQEGVLSGTLDVPVADQPVDVPELFRDEADEEAPPEGSDAAR